MYRDFVASPLLFVVISLAGCKSSNNSIEGAWQSENFPGLPFDSRVEFVFLKPDYMKMHTALTHPKHGEMEIEIAGTYSVAGDTLTFNFKEMKYDTSDVNSESKQYVNNEMAKAKAPMLAELNRAPSQTLTWDGPDKFSGKNSAGQIAQYSRIKL